MLEKEGDMAGWELGQLTKGGNNFRPTISDDGRRVAFKSRSHMWLYDKDSDNPLRKLYATVGGDDRVLVSPYPQISGDGKKIVFDARGYYTDEEETGIYIYDIDSGDVRLVVKDSIPRWPTGAARMGEPGMKKFVNTMPSISSDGHQIAYVLTEYGYGAATRDHWTRVRQQLLVAEISDSGVRGNAILEITVENAHGNGIQSLRMSGDGRSIAFYAGGAITGLEVGNLEMPPYETVVHEDSIAGPVGNVYCYVARRASSGRNTLQVVFDPDSPKEPLVVAHPLSGNIQSFDLSNVLRHPPGICRDGSRVVLHAGFVMGSEKTGVYVYEPDGLGSATHEIVTFGARPGAGPGEPVLSTSVVPSISADGKWLAFYLREVSFPEGYGDPSVYEEGETYCPWVLKDDVQVRRIPDGETSDLIEGAESAVYPIYTSTMSLALAEEARYLTFVSRADIVGRNPDWNHQVFYCSRLASLGGQKKPQKG